MDFLHNAHNLLYSYRMENRNHEVTKLQPLLNKDGHILEEGWARHPVWQYDRSKIKASAFKIKEWDYYAITSQSQGWTVCGTISDLGYAALLSVSYIDYKLGKFAQADEMKFFTLGKLSLSSSSQIDNSCQYIGKNIRLTFIKRGSSRHIMIAAPSLKHPDGRVGLDLSAVLTQPQEMESLNIATSWAENRHAFYLNEKVNCMPARGLLRRGDDTIELSQTDVFGVLDWGRGRWTYQNTWYWSSGSGLVNGHKFGFNLGYGFTDRTPASENVIFYDNKVHKLEDITFNIPENYMKNWKFTSSDGRFEMDFKPAVDRCSKMNFGVIKTNQHQVFGYFTGKAKLDDKTVIEVKDFPAFAEKVFNRY
jgi:hypothetical protein